MCQDDTHFEIAMAAVEAGMHVLVTKPAVKTLEHHHELAAAAAKHNVLVRYACCAHPTACAPPCTACLIPTASPACVAHAHVDRL